MTEPRRVVLDEDGLRCLLESIAHWERMATGTTYEGELPGPKHCDLCKRWLADNCATSREDRCPIYQATGRRGCKRTPYSVAANAYYDYGGRSARFRRAAARELAFLRDLLARAEKENPAPKEVEP